VCRNLTYSLRRYKKLFISGVLLLSFVTGLLLAENKTYATPSHLPYCYNSQSVQFKYPARWTTEVKKNIERMAVRNSFNNLNWATPSGMKIMMFKDVASPYRVLVADSNFTITIKTNGVATNGSYSGASEIIVEVKNNAATAKEYYYIGLFASNNYANNEAQANTLAAGATGTFTSGNAISCMDFALGVTYDTTYSLAHEPFNTTLPYATDQTIFPTNYANCTEFCVSSTGTTGDTRLDDEQLAQYIGLFLVIFITYKFARITGGINRGK